MYLFYFSLHIYKDYHFLISMFQNENINYNGEETHEYEILVYKLYLKLLSSKVILKSSILQS